MKGDSNISYYRGCCRTKKSNLAIATANLGGTDAKNGSKVLATGASG
ncbi:Variable major outer membrane lipoprotein (plasmid) [Borrelia miyamotoi FR64b]|uniref:Variable major outer membrane lipoprotein n=1 Tax=Borrelia miyamotoi FR64b TaxID=1292392 RepID=W5SFQ3_9SPIR|nr:Variable major outer membrane lipoprotein [Borrelia miyamotoi FR64b]